MANGKRNASGSGDNSPSPKKPRHDSPKRLPTPILSPSDKKAYRHIELPNGLRVLLISDQGLEANPSWSHTDFESHSLRFDPEHKIRVVVPPNALQLDLSIDVDNSRLISHSSSGVNFFSIDVDRNGPLTHSSSGRETNLSREVPVSAKAAMCLIVNTGWLDDPPQFAGMAHFTEHMIHYGSKKHPNDGIYWNFITNLGSYINAYTQCHTTAYNVAINPDFLKEGLRLFSECISDPLFDPKTTLNEVQSVDNEFRIRSVNDFRKMNEIIKSAVIEDHPFRKFDCGNEETLKQNSLLPQLKQFHSNNYVAKRMTFAIQSTDSLDTLQKMVENSMNCIKSGSSIEQPQSIDTNEIFNEESFSKLYKLQGERKLILIWKFDSSVWKDFKSKPLQFLEILMNDRGVDTLYDKLTQRGWMMEMDSGCGKCENFQNNYCSIFTNIILLTESGERNVERVVQYFFDFIDMLLATPQNCFEIKWNETRDSSKQLFDHCGNGTPLNNTHFAARKMMTHGPVATFLSKDIVFEGEYDPTPLMQVLKSISRKKTLYIQFTQSEVTKGKDMQYYNFKYTKEDIPRGFIDVNVDETLQFPDENTFITSSTQIRPSAEPFDYEDEKISVALKPNRGMTTSKCRYRMNMFSPESERTPFHRQLLPLLAYLLELKIKNELKLASRAGIKTRIGHFRQGIFLSMVGFPENMPDVLRRFCEIFNEEAFSIEMFQIIKQMGQLEYTSTIKSPFNLMSKLYQSLHMVDQKSILESPNQIPTLNQASFTEYIKLFKSSMYIDCTLEGNVSKHEALEVRQILQGIPYGHAGIEAFFMQSTKLVLPNGERTIRVRAVNSHNNNNEIINLYQIPIQDEENERMCHVATNLMRGPAFTLLRTRQQLGYTVHVFASREIPVKFAINIQAPNTNSLCSLNAKIDAFLDKFYKEFLSQMTEREFRKCKTNMHLEDIVSLDSMKAWYRDNIYDRNFNKLRKLSLQVIGSSSPKANWCKCEFCSAIEFKPSGNTDVEFATYKKPNTKIAGTQKLIDNISKFYEEQVRK